MRTASIRISSIASGRTDTMSTQQTLPTTASPAAAPKRALITAAWIALAIGVLAFIAYHARTGAVSPRIANPEVTGPGVPPRPVEFFKGRSDTAWIVRHQ